WRPFIWIWRQRSAVWSVLASQEFQIAPEKSTVAWHHKNSTRPRESRMASMDPQTLGLLYRQHGPALRLYARQWGDHAEDLVQEAFVHLVQQSPPPEHLLPWLYRVIRNQAYADNRTTSRRRK